MTCGDENVLSALIATDSWRFAGMPVSIFVLWTLLLMSGAYLQGTEKTDQRPTDWLRREEVVRGGVHGVP